MASSLASRTMSASDFCLVFGLKTEEGKRLNTGLIIHEHANTHIELRQGVPRHCSVVSDLGCRLLCASPSLSLQYSLIECYVKDVSLVT